MDKKHIKNKEINLNKRKTNILLKEIKPSFNVGY